MTGKTFGETRASAPQTVARVLQRFGRIRKRRVRGLVSLVYRAPSVTAAAPNDVWTVDFKGGGAVTTVSWVNDRARVIAKAF